MNFRLLTAGLFFLVSLICVAANYYYLKSSIHNNLVKIEVKNAGIYYAKDYDELKKIGYEWIYEVPMTDAVIQNMGRKRVGLFWGSYLIIVDSKTGKIKNKFYKSDFVFYSIINKDGYSPF